MKENYQKQLDALLASLPPESKPRLLLQSCCGPCSSYVLEYLTRYFRVTVLYYNPNIQPRSEYDRRLYWQRELIRQLPTPEPVELLACDYDGQRYIDAVRGLEREPEGGAQSWVRCILAALMPVVFNFVLVGAVLTWSLTDAVFPHLNASFWVFGGQVALGEIAVLGVLGLPLMRLLPRNPKFREIIRSYQKE